MMAGEKSSVVKIFKKLCIANIRDAKGSQRDKGGEWSRILCVSLRGRVFFLSNIFVSCLIDFMFPLYVFVVIAFYPPSKSLLIALYILFTICSIF